MPVDTLHIDNARVTLDTSRDISKVKIRPVRDPRSVPVSQPVMPMLSTAPTTLPYAADLWHRRYGHMPASTMMMLPHVTTGCEFKLTPQQAKRHRDSCSICMQSRMRRAPETKKAPRFEKSRAPGELVHSDLLGPLLASLDLSLIHI